MKKSLIASAVAGALFVPAVTALADDAPASPHTLTANVGVVSDYVFRGISQSHTEMAVQGGFDYSHSSGFYLGTWGSSISWVNDGYGGSTPTEIDVYGGFRGSLTDDVGYDVGVITYNYPGNGRASGLPSPNTTELYLGASYKWLSVKYSYTTSKNFVGWTTSTGGDTDGSDYIEANAAWDLGQGWGLNAHIGHQKVKDNDPASYSDWAIGVTKDVGFGVVGLKYTDTNNKGDCNSSTGTTNGNAYCWGSNLGTSNFEDVSEGTAILSFTKSF